MLDIFYASGFLFAFQAAYVSYGEEMIEEFPHVERTQEKWLVLFTFVSSIFSWISWLYFKQRHKNFIKA